MAHKLVADRLAACVNVVAGIRSHYRWQGAVESAGEVLLVIKSVRGRFAALRAAIEAGHSYEVPEVLALPVIEGSPNYLAWLTASVAESGE